MFMYTKCLYIETLKELPNNDNEMTHTCLSLIL